MQPGRVCPLHYRYLPSAFAREPEIVANAIYVIGGLYGNQPALDAILALAFDEPIAPTLVFNGDFNWFNVDLDGFIAINNAVLKERALRGNVETELASDDDAAGCGCAYPESVSDSEVARSNAILGRLRETARRVPALRQLLGALPMNAVAQVGDLRVGIVHGDAESLAGWGFDVSVLDQPAHQRRLTEWFSSARVEVFASSHTCLPVAREIATLTAPRWIINNGAAGMPNFASTRFGVITRIALSPAPRELRLYGFASAGVFIDAIAVRYDHSRWLGEFLANWPPGSPARVSYHRRIVAGPNFSPARARPLHETAFNHRPRP